MLNPSRSAGRPRRGLLPVVGALALIVVLSGCSVHGSGKSGHEQNAPVAVTPNAINKLPANIGEVTITIDNGKFGVGQVTLQAQGGSVIHVANHDATAYRLQIVPNLVTAEAIAPSTTTNVDFAASQAGTYTGQLLPQQGSTVLATVTILLESAGGVKP